MPTGSGKSLCYQLPALDADRPDAGRLAAGLADAGPGGGAAADRSRARGAGQRAAGLDDQPARRRARRGRVGAAAVRGAGAVRLAGVPGPDPGCAARPVRGRRGALRLPVGARLPARLLPARGCRPVAGRGGDRGLDGDRHAVRGAGHRRASGAARPGPGLDRVRPAEPLVLRRAVREQGGGPPADRRGAGARPRRGRRSSTRARARSPTGWPSASGASSAWRCSPTTRGCRATCARRRSGGSWMGRRRWWWPRTRSGWAWTSRTCGRSATSRCRARSRRTTRRRAAPVATGRPPAACCSRPAATRGCTCSSSSARRSRRGSCKAVARAIVRSAEGDPSRFNLHLNELARREGEEEGVRAIVGYMARAGVIQPAPSAPDRIVGRVIGTWDRVSLGVCRSAAEEGTRIRWRQYRAVWAWVEGGGCRREGILRHFGDRRGARADRAVLRRLRPVARARPGARTPAALARRRRWISTARSWRSSPPPRRASAARAASRSCAAAARRRSRSTPTTAWRTTARTATWAPRRSSPRSTPCSPPGRLRSTGGRFPKLEVA